MQAWIRLSPPLPACARTPAAGATATSIATLATTTPAPVIFRMDSQTSVRAPTIELEC
jgi:hypothetical protein